MPIGLMNPWLQDICSGCGRSELWKLSTCWPENDIQKPTLSLKVSLHNVALIASFVSLCIGFIRLFWKYYIYTESQCLLLFPGKRTPEDAMSFFIFLMYFPVYTAEYSPLIQSYEGEVFQFIQNAHFSQKTFWLVTAKNGNGGTTTVTLIIAPLLFSEAVSHASEVASTTLQHNSLETSSTLGSFLTEAKAKTISKWKRICT